MAKKKQITSKKSKREKSPPPPAGSSTSKVATASSSLVQAPKTLQIDLLSDATFSRGEGTAGVVDTEVEHDEFGMPYIGGKSVRGLLRDSWLSMEAHFSELHEAAARVLGHSQALDDTCRLRIGDAVLPDEIRDVVRRAVKRGERPIDPRAMLGAFTTVRYQTAEDRETGAPEGTTLRSSRVVLRGFVFQSKLLWLDGYQPNDKDLRVLTLCALTTRHGGLLRNRGRGHVLVTLDGDVELTKRCLEATR